MTFGVSHVFTGATMVLLARRWAWPGSDSVVSRHLGQGER